MSEERRLRISFRGIEVFIAAVEEGSITGAAKRLGASPSSVSLQLSNLEAALDARLIERSAQRFELTTAGETFRPSAMRILDEVSSAQAALSATNKSPRMVIRIAIVEEFDANVIPHWLCKLEEIFPKCRFLIKSGTSHENYSALTTRSADMIVAVDATDAADWVEEHPIFRDPYILVTTSDAPSRVRMKALMQRPFIRYSRDQYMGRQIEAQLRRIGTMPPRGHEFSSNQAVLSMVAATGGWAITTASVLAGTLVATDEANPVLQARPLPLPAFSRCVSLHARRDALGDMPARFAEVLRESVAETTVEPACSKMSFLRDALRIMPQECVEK